MTGPLISLAGLPEFRESMRRMDSAELADLIASATLTAGDEMFAQSLRAAPTMTGSFSQDRPSRKFRRHP